MRVSTDSIVFQYYYVPNINIPAVSHRNLKFEVKIIMFISCFSEKGFGSYLLKRHFIHDHSYYNYLVLLN